MTSARRRNESRRWAGLTGRPLEGRVAVVTGAGRGIGRAHALQLAQLGATVVVNDPGVERDGTGGDTGPAAAVGAEIEQLGGRALIDIGDVGSVAAGRDLIARTIAALGRVDVLVNNAGIAGGELFDVTDAGLDRMLGVHLKGPVGTMTAAVADMRSRGWGRIVNTVSEVALDPRFATTGLAYGAAKASIWSATLSAARACEGTGVTVNAISPGALTRMNAEMLKVGYHGQSRSLDLDPAHVARVAAWLISEEAFDVSGRIIHAAAGAVREYETRRSGGTDLARRIAAALSGE